MKKLVKLLFVILILTACKKTEGPVPEVTFTINISDFQISDNDFTDLKSVEDDVFANFTHKYPIGELTFLNAEEMSFQFNSEPNAIDELSITLPVGTYALSGMGGAPAALGSAQMSLIIPSQEITIEESSTEVDITVTPTCGLFLVADEENLLDSAYINDASTAFFVDGNYYYSYFIPESDNSVFLIKKESATLNFSTQNLQIGIIYKIIVAEGSSQPVIITPDFTTSDLITW